MDTWRYKVAELFEFLSVITAHWAPVVSSCFDFDLSAHRRVVVVPKHSGAHPHTNARFHCRREERTWTRSWHTASATPAGRLLQMCSCLPTTLLPTVWGARPTLEGPALFKTVVGRLFPSVQSNTTPAAAHKDTPRYATELGLRIFIISS